MTRKHLAGGAAALLFSLVLLPLLGCGTEGVGKQGEVALVATFQPARNRMAGVTLATEQPGDSLDRMRATAEIARPNNTSAPVSISVNSAHTLLTLGAANLVPSPGSGVASRDRARAASQADVPLVATVTADLPNMITGVVVRTVDPGDTISVEGARASVNHSDGTADPVSLTANAEGTEVTLGPAKAVSDSSPGRYWEFDRLLIEGPVSFRDGATGSKTEIGSLVFGFAVKEDGTVLAPKTIRASIPTIGVATDQRIVVEGVRPESAYVWIGITDNAGGFTYSRAHLADESGIAVIPDTKSRITAELISGPNSAIELYFAGWPKYPYPYIGLPVDDVGPPLPPAAPGGGGGGAEGRSSLNVLRVTGPLRVRAGATGASTQLGWIQFGFEVMQDGTVIAPKTVRIRVPVGGAAGTETAVASGMRSGDLMQTAVVLANGGHLVSRAHRAGRGGQASVPDALIGVTGAALSGRHSSLSLFFARTRGLLF